MIIDGEEIAAGVRESVASDVEQLDQTPKLVAVLMSDDPASETYVRMKKQACEEVGIEAETLRIDPEATEEELFSAIDDLNRDETVNGFIVQSPLPDHVSEKEAFEAVSPRKDVDGFHPENKGRLMDGRPRFVPATPKGIQRLLVESGNPPEGKDVVVLGRSDIVGKPLANLLLSRSEDANATVTVCHSRTDDLDEHTRRADVLVAAVGKPEYVTSEMVSEGVVVVDVGINRVDVDKRSSSGSQNSESSGDADNEKGYELVGDVDFDSVREKASAITPVPGGVGPMTVAMLLENTVEATRLQSR
ncbi:MAG: tetrahydrofolate dehydrogenase/cyclohydrolase catalytic domain-containing protein [Halobacteria archaeon]|nr:tetrahydrofolate dehydrogenase/cyclohydrolase catalytic domain-containing protein [Halobacteria archaeon]